jgi:hypothetical protein
VSAGNIAKSALFENKSIWPACSSVAHHLGNPIHKG